MTATATPPDPERDGSVAARYICAVVGQAGACPGRHGRVGRGQYEAHQASPIGKPAIEQLSRSGRAWETCRTTKPPRRFLLDSTVLVVYFAAAESLFASQDVGQRNSFIGVGRMMTSLRYAATGREPTFPKKAVGSESDARILKAIFVFMIVVAVVAAVAGCWYALAIGKPTAALIVFLISAAFFSRIAC